MTEINPVTEPEVMSFAQRIVTTIVSVSQQARDIDSLRHRLDNLSSDFSRLVEENDKLKREVAETWEFVKTVEAERDQAKRNAELSEARVAESQQEAARAWDTRNRERAEAAELNNKLTNLCEDKDKRIAELERELGQANSHVASLKATNEEQAFRIVKQAESITHKDQGLDRLYIELHDAQAKRDASETKLGNVQAKLNDLRSLFDSPKEATPSQGFDDAGYRVA